MRPSVCEPQQCPGEPNRCELEERLACGANNAVLGKQAHRVGATGDAHPEETLSARKEGQWSGRRLAANVQEKGPARVNATVLPNPAYRQKEVAVRFWGNGDLQP